MDERQRLYHSERNPLHAWDGSTRPDGVTTESQGGTFSWYRIPWTDEENKSLALLYRWLRSYEIKADNHWVFNWNTVLCRREENILSSVDPRH